LTEEWNHRMRSVTQNNNSIVNMIRIALKQQNKLLLNLLKTT